MNYTFAPNCQIPADKLNAIYKEAFGEKTDGSFVEVGASNGQDYSNTCGLADLGWYGVYVEPVKELAEKCRKRHPQHCTWNGAVGAYDGTQEMQLIKDWGTATFNRKAALSISSDIVSFLTDVEKLNTLLNNHFFRPGFDLLVIDVDFGEIEVLKGFTIADWKPKLVIIELHEESQHPLSEEVRQFALPYFAEAGYANIYRDGINTIFRAP